MKAIKSRSDVYSHQALNGPSLARCPTEIKGEISCARDEKYASGLKQQRRRLDGRGNTPVKGIVRKSTCGK
jgi:hypothetical protein